MKREEGGRKVEERRIKVVVSQRQYAVSVDGRGCMSFAVIVCVCVKECNVREKRDSCMAPLTHLVRCIETRVCWGVVRHPHHTEHEKNCRKYRLRDEREACDNIRGEGM